VLHKHLAPVDEPIGALTSGLIATVRMLHEWESTAVLPRALRWYSSGVRSQFAEDQFQFFWFVIELFAASSKERGKVTDKCQRCGGDLACQDCNRVSTHRPFGKQLIEQILERIGVSADQITELFYIRNSLLTEKRKNASKQRFRRNLPNLSFLRPSICLAVQPGPRL
jgi:hypothetical protein